MRVMVTGSRSWDRPDVVAECLDILARQAANTEDTEFVVVHGAAPLGADAHADAWVRDADHLWELQVTAERHPANWKRDGRAAGFIRNKAMVRAGADIVLAFHRDNSNGTAHTIRLAEEAEIPTRVIDYADLKEKADA